MQKISNLLGHGLFYTLALSIESVAPFILAPVLTHYLSVYEFGLWAIFQCAMAFLRPLLGLTLDDYVRMRYYQQSQEKMVGYLFSIIILSGFFAIILCLLAIIFRSPVSHLLEFPPSWLWAIILGAWLHAMFYILLAYYQFETKRMRFAIIHAVQAGVTLLVSILLVMSGFGWTGAVIGKLVGLACGGGLALLWIVLHFPKSACLRRSEALLPSTSGVKQAPASRRQAEKYIQPRHALELISFGWRYLPSGMAPVVITLTDRLMLAHKMDVQAASLFTVASLFPMVLGIVINGFIAGWQPWCFLRLSRREPGDVKQLALGALLFFVLLPCGGVILAYISCWLGPYVIAEQFHAAFNYVFPLMMAMVALGFYMFARSILHFYHRLELMSAIALMAMAIAAAVNYLLINRLGILGSAWADIIAYGLAFLVTAAFAGQTLRKHYLA